MSTRGARASGGIAVQRSTGAPYRSAAIRTGARAATILLGGDESGLAPERFSTAAALGRLVADRGASPAPLGAAQGPVARLREAQRANAFAAELLLPRAALAARGWHDVPGLCDDCGISRSAAEWHIRNRRT